MKYKLTENTKQIGGITLYQIRSLNDFGDVKAGDLGGWIESESNLSQEGNCWVYVTACVFATACVSENAQVYGNAQVSRNARVYGNAKVYGNTLVYGYAQVYGNARVYEHAKVSGNALVFGDAQVYGNARVEQNMHIKFGRVTTELSTDLISNIEAQTNLGVFNSEVYCYKHVRDDLTSLHDSKFQYRVNEWIEVNDPDLSNNSCANGLHVSHKTYWNGNNGKKILFCKVRLEDIITVQGGKIRCKRLFVIGVCDGLVY